MSVAGIIMFHSILEILKSGKEKMKDKVPASLSMRVMVMWRRAASLVQEINLVAQHFPKDTNRRTSVDLRRYVLDLSVSLAQTVKQENTKPQLLEKIKTIESKIAAIQDEMFKLSDKGLVDKITAAQINGEIERLKDDAKSIRSELTFGV